MRMLNVKHCTNNNIQLNKKTRSVNGFTRLGWIKMFYPSLIIPGFYGQAGLFTYTRNRCCSLNIGSRGHDFILRGHNIRMSLPRQNNLVATTKLSEPNMFPPGHRTYELTGVGAVVA